MHNESNDKKNLVSVIVPVYNAENYIKECVNSILNQSYKDLELILVDDGSSDKSGFICDQLAIADVRLKVIHQVNSGVCVARNNALKIISGRWVTFVDSDDWLESNCIERCIQALKAVDADLLQFCYKRVTNDGSIISKVVHKDTKVLSCQEYIDEEDHLSVSVWGSIFKTEIIKDNDIRFYNGITLGEDQLFVFRYVHHSHNCIRISDTLYNYRVNPNSATAGNNSNECLKSLKFFLGFKYRHEFEYYTQNAIFRNFLYPVVYDRTVSFLDLYNLIKNETFDRIIPSRKIEYLFFPIFNMSRILGLLFFYSTVRFLSSK